MYTKYLFYSNLSILHAKSNIFVVWNHLLIKIGEFVDKKGGSFQGWSGEVRRFSRKPLRSHITTPPKMTIINLFSTEYHSDLRVVYIFPIPIQKIDSNKVGAGKDRASCKVLSNLQASSFHFCITLRTDQQSAISGIHVYTSGFAVLSERHQYNYLLDFVLHVYIYSVYWRSTLDVLVLTVNCSLG